MGLKYSMRSLEFEKEIQKTKLLKLDTTLLNYLVYKMQFSLKDKGEGCRSSLADKVLLTLLVVIPRLTHG